MGQILTQEEVDALLKGISGGEIETEADSYQEGQVAKPFDFLSQEKIKRHRMPTLDIVHGKFVRQFRVSLSSFLRQPVDSAVVSTKMVKFNEFVRSLPVPTSIHILKLEPLRGLALFVVESKFVFALIDYLFGGKGNNATKIEGREFTAIEQRMVKKVVLLALRDLELAWKSVEALKISLERSEINPQFASIVPPDEVVMVVNFEVEMAETNGVMTLCIPYSTLEPVKEKLVADFQCDKIVMDKTWLNNLKENLLMAAVDLTVELGRTTIKVQELMKLKKGDIIRLDNNVQQELMGKAAEVKKFKCHPGATKFNRAVRVTSLL